MDRLDPIGPDGKTIPRLIPLGRYGDAREVANAAVFLFSDAGAFITGQVIVVDGGGCHFPSSTLPYPQAVLDPNSVKRSIASRL
jgi:2,4-dienoyl-CoA reductase [(3E)-enoyl-CoA-producing], peroxisomal